MKNTTLTKIENVAVRIGARKARDNERRARIIDYYTGNKAPEAPEQKRH